MSVATFACLDGPPLALPAGVVGVKELCRRPSQIVDLCSDPPGVVMVLHSDGFEVAAVQTAVRSLGVDPLGMQVVSADALGTDPERTERVLRGAAARAAAFPGSDPEHARTIFAMSLTRRGLLRLPRAHYVAVPLIDRASCAAGDGCRACVTACPREAYRWVNGRIRFDRLVCEPCGICVTACPAGAIANPAIDPAALDAQIRALLRDATGSLGIAFKCSRGRMVAAASDWYEVEVPCTGMVPGNWLLGAILLGAGSVAALPCGAVDCPLDNADRAATAVRFAREALGAAGLEPERARTDCSTSPLESMTPVSLDSPFGTAGAAEVIVALAGMSSGLPVGFDHEGSPLGEVVIDPEVCTLCTQCARACPTGALTADSEKGAISISFDPQLCPACNQCAPMCPELRRGAIAVLPRADVGSLQAGRRVLASGVASTCEVCGGSVAPQPMLERIGALLGEEHGGALDYLARRCLDCRGQ